MPAGLPLSCNHERTKFGTSRELRRGVYVPIGKRGAVARVSRLGPRVFQAALPAAILRLVELWTLNVRITGSDSSKCRIVSCMCSYSARWYRSVQADHL
jgi:hypothetical protein